MRYFLEFAYNGTRFNGYQIQPNAPSIQEAIEKALSTVLRVPTQIVGCGRTDTGVHALQYFAHFDFKGPVLDEQLLLRLNALLGKDILMYRLIPVEEQAHARFDASSRSYIYYVSKVQNPFRQETAYYCPFSRLVDVDKMQLAAQLLLEYQDFSTFCKTNTDTKTKNCDLRRSAWVVDEQNQLWMYKVTANRFLRGMIRLIVGMCLNVGRGKISMEELRNALDQQLPLKQAWSAPAEGLFLTDIQYPYIENSHQVVF